MRPRWDAPEFASVLGLLSIVATTRRIERGGRSVFCNYRKPGFRVGLVIENVSEMLERLVGEEWRIS